MTDRVLPFQTERTPLRGRLVRLGPLLGGMLGRHDYPEPVARLLGETALLAAALGSILKYDGVFTLQIKGDGPVGLMVVDIVGTLAATPRVVRGYARFDHDAVAKMAADPHLLSMSLVGRGWLAFTVDQGPDTERYQGIVALRGRTLAECVQHYFLQSEQLATGLRVAIGHENGVWNGTALLLQRLPGDGPSAGADPGSSEEDDWRRAMVLMATLTAPELLDQDLGDQPLLWRLFHEDGIRVFEENHLIEGCRCSRDKVISVLRSLDRAELDGLRENGIVTVTCEFCTSAYRFDDRELAALSAP
ncbi:MAG: Hsp33 family molecular chaperone HslO [Rhodospirillaceae bacterium]